MNGIKGDPDSKMDMDAITPSGSGYMDDDFFEDTGELTLPPKNNEAPVWIARIPKWLYEAVSQWEDVADGREDDQIQIGDIVAFRDPQDPTKISKTKPMRMFLKHAPHHATIPQAFELKTTAAPADVLGNTYVFTEKDLPGYRPNGLGFGKTAASGSFGVQDPKARIQKRGRWRKAIPKQTALIGHTAREFIANPLNTREYVEFQRERTRKAILGNASKTNIDDNMHDHSMSTNVTKNFKNFIKSNQPNRSQTNKAARIPRNELIDLLHSLFDQYAYWPMKALKQKTRQPEAYLKEVLQEIADLIKSGTFASNYKRKSFFAENRGVTAQEASGFVAKDETASDDDDDLDMEDVGV